MEKTVKIFPTPPDLAKAFAAEMAEMISKSSSGPFTIALSGGSTPRLLFKILGEDFKTVVNWKNVHLFWGDERCVPPDNKESNYGMTKKELLDHISIPASNVHRIKGENDPLSEAARYSEEIRTFTRQRDGYPLFDLIILGLGEDGHTASIFPGQTGLLVSDNICAVGIHPASKQKRITITGRVINNAEKIVFLATGRNKSEVVEKLFKNSAVSDSIPAAGIVPVHGLIIWFLDDESARLL